MKQEKGAATNSHGASVNDQRKPMNESSLPWKRSAIPFPPSTPMPTLAPLLVCNEPKSDVEMEILGEIVIPEAPQMASDCKSDNSIMKKPQRM
jgi:hypothetical protein